MLTDTCTKAVILLHCCYHSSCIALKSTDPGLYFCCGYCGSIHFYTASSGRHLCRV